MPDRYLGLPKIFLAMAMIFAVIALAQYLGHTTETYGESLEFRSQLAASTALDSLLLGLASVFLRLAISVDWSKKRRTFVPIIAVFVLLLVGYCTYFFRIIDFSSSTLFGSVQLIVILIGGISLLSTIVGILVGKAWGWWLGWPSLLIVALIIGDSHINGVNVAEKYSSYSAAILMMSLGLVGAMLCDRELRYLLSVGSTYGICRVNMLLVLFGLVFLLTAPFGYVLSILVFGVLFLGRKHSTIVQSIIAPWFATAKKR